ncbi:hypothetical protein [Photobacterium leiognathi]|uniref:hypothetical protein n=1 Tax=Photobacterium leiognathi TaxID=553611 RepID=UPI002981A828|nr:hypothetical protein [Photobacterium leiognathi]
MIENRRLAGSELDKYIESELLAMVREGLEQSPIKAVTLHKRLLSKGLVSGSLSTLSIKHRKEMIQKYQKQQHNQMNLSDDELELLVEGRKANEAYRSKAVRMEKERDAMKEQLDLNTFAVLDIINTVEVATAIKIEDLLSSHLIRELTKMRK